MNMSGLRLEIRQIGPKPAQCQVIRALTLGLVVMLFPQWRPPRFRGTAAKYRAGRHRKSQQTL